MPQPLLDSAAMTEAADKQQPPRGRLKGRLRRLWCEMKGLIAFLAVMVLFRSAVADWNQVPTGSMKPTILEGDRVVVNKLAYGLRFPFTDWQLSSWADPGRGEIVTFRSPKDGKLMIKRVIGIPGDLVAMQENRLYVNDEPATYNMLDLADVSQLDLFQRHRHTFLYEQVGGHKHIVMLRSASANPYRSFKEIVVPPGYYLMLGDNRDNSADSRALGLVARSSITGRAHTVAFSVDYDSYYLPRLDRFIHPLE